MPIEGLLVAKEILKADIKAIRGKIMTPGQASSELSNLMTADPWESQQPETNTFKRIWALRQEVPTLIAIHQAKKAGIEPAVIMGLISKFSPESDLGGVDVLMKSVPPFATFHALSLVVPPLFVGGRVGFKLFQKEVIPHEEMITAGLFFLATVGGKLAQDVYNISHDKATCSGLAILLHTKMKLSPFKAALAERSMLLVACSLGLASSLLIDKSGASSAGFLWGQAVYYSLGILIDLLTPKSDVSANITMGGPGGN